MTGFDNQITALLSWDIFRQFSCGEQITLFKYNALTTMLVNNNIPFDVKFENQTRRNAASIALTIYITPTMNLTLDITLGAGGNNVNG